jgi:hypothetical protein
MAQIGSCGSNLYQMSRWTLPQDLSLALQFEPTEFPAELLQSHEQRANIHPLLYQLELVDLFIASC